jgi:hypothetical protein
MKIRKQFNVRICGNLKRRVALDRANTGASNDIVVEVALENWFSKFNQDQRTKFYRTHGRKAYERAA